MARDGGRGRGAAARGRGRSRKNTGVRLNLNPESRPSTSTPTTTTTTTHTTTPLSLDLFKFQGPRTVTLDELPRTYEMGLIPPTRPLDRVWLRGLPDNHSQLGLVDNSIKDTEAAGSATADTRLFLLWDGHDCWDDVKKGTKEITDVFQEHYKWYPPSSAKHLMRQSSSDGSSGEFRRGDEANMRKAWEIRAAKHHRGLMHKIREAGAPHH
ncbi:hypothetical protein PIB30_056352 [Stylosanthes scabra]|uniref:Uncharacterized protein n=1 Tax=Stylosanthes scabra TaxID=79078 RepID=A0ABU6ZI38_9FABA|nr:hypothetical protein [Stylosanthes scabra]